MPELKVKEKSEASSGQITRRQFTQLLTAVPLSLSLMPATWFSSSQTRNKATPFTSRHLLQGKFEYFGPYEATVIERVTALLIPTDQDPGAREAEVVFELDRIVARSEKLKDVYTKGIDWLDYMARRMFGQDSFLDVEQYGQLKILDIAESGTLGLLDKVFLFLRYRKLGTGKRFFSQIKRQSFEIFYTSEIGWKMVGYQGPPQWSGYLDYYQCGRVDE